METELGRLQAEGLQDDRRFAELFADQRVNRGDGPLKIRAALSRRGIDDADADAVLAPWSQEWPARAAAALERHFGTAPASDRREAARRGRFLQGRGFPAEVIRRVLDGTAAE